MKINLDQMLRILIFIIIFLLIHWILQIWSWHSNPLNRWVHVPSWPAWWYSSSYCQLSFIILVILNLLFLLFILVIFLFQKFVEHGVLMLSGNMIFEKIFLKFLIAFSTFIKFFRTIFIQMNCEVSLFHSDSTIIRTVNFKITDNFAQTHICLKTYRQLLLATWAYFRVVWKHAEAVFANYRSTLLTIKRLIWEFIAAYAFHMFKT